MKTQNNVGFTGNKRDKAGCLSIFTFGIVAIELELAGVQT